VIRRPVAIAATALWCFVAASFARAGLVQQGPKLVGAGAAYGIGAGQGSAVAISGDGNAAIVGASLDSSNAGAAWMFTRTSGAWSQQGTKLVGTGAIGAAKQGVSVAMSADGNTAIVGGSADNGNLGATWVFAFNGDTWSQQAKLVGSPVGIEQQGSSVALSGDGSTAIVGGPLDNSGAGAAWVFVRLGSWLQQGAKLVGGAAAGGARQGSSVALSADGRTAIVGGPLDNAGKGAAWVYTYNGTTWTQQGAKLVGTGAVGAGHQGQSVALSADGNTAVVGGPDDNASAGAVWVYTRSGGVWTQQGAKLVGDGSAGLRHGASVSVSGDGNTVIVGAPGAGATWVYTRRSGAWGQFGDVSIGSGGAGSTGQGTSVALSADASTALVGGPTDANSAGAAWVFVYRAEPVIASAVDIPNDQGGWLRLTVEPSSGDDPGALDPVTTYGVWRSVPETIRYACSVVGFSSQRGTTLWSADRALGPPDVYPDAVDSPNAWASLTADGQPEHVDLQFSDPAPIDFVSVYETLNPGAVSAVLVMNPGTGMFESVWSGTAASSPDPARIFSVTFPQTSYPVGVVRIQLDSPSVPGWNEIDAVAIGAGAPPTTAQALARVPRFPTPGSFGARGGDVRTLAIGGGLGATAASPTLPCGTWELVTSMPALQQSRYLVAVPTVSNSTPGEFIVTASTADPSVWYVSVPASGQSLDNLAPATPAPFAAAYSGGATHLHWGRNGETDLGSYHVHRGGSSGFTPSPGNLIASTNDTGYVDVGPAGSYYKLSALDVNGNESGYALVTPATTLAVDGEPALALALERVTPNPSRGQRLAVTFTLPVAGPARLEMLDVGGRLIAAREVGILGPGRHTVDPGIGRKLRPGLYLVRLTQGGESRVIRAAVVM